MTGYDQPGYRGATPWAPGGWDARTGASQGSVPPAGGDEHLADVTVSELYASSQAETDTVSVGTGDTSGMSDDTPAHNSAIVAGGGDLMATGAGQGSTIRSANHPNAR